MTAQGGQSDRGDPQMEGAAVRMPAAGKKGELIPPGNASVSTRHRHRGACQLRVAPADRRVQRGNFEDGEDRLIPAQAYSRLPNMDKSRIS